MLPVKSMPASVEFYGKLGFSVEERNDGWGWAMLRFGECRLLVDQSINVHPGRSASGRLDDPDGNRLWIGRTRAERSR
jgi:catechol 2,3-dioxygenase-like lactoylglutathione lyase family enzyme